MLAWGDLLSTGLGLFAGGFITWAVARWYYVRAGQQLRDESARLRKLAALALKAFEEAGVEFTKDSEGNFMGVVRQGASAIGVSAAVAAEGQNDSHDVDCQREKAS